MFPTGHISDLFVYALKRGGGGALPPHVFTNAKFSRKPSDTDKNVEIYKGNSLALFLVPKQSLGDDWNKNHVIPADEIHRNSHTTKLWCDSVIKKPLEVGFPSSIMTN